MMYMKKLLIAGACMAALVSFNAFAQGQVNFANKATAAGLDAPVFDVGGAKLAGPDAFAQLYSSGKAQGAPVAFRSGTGAGYFTGGGLTVDNVAAGANGTFMVKAWIGAAGSTYDTAAIKGASAEFSAKTGGDGAPPSPATTLLGLTSFTLVPEPSVLALGAIGLAALLLRRRS